MKSPLEQLEDAHISGKRCDMEGRTREASAFYRICLDIDPTRFDILRDWCYATANHDRAAVIDVLDDRLGRETDKIAAAKLLMLQLPYLESTRRELASLDHYSATHAFEKPFEFSQMEVAHFCALASTAKIETQSSINLLAAAKFISWDFPATQAFLDMYREHGRGDPRVSAVYLRGDWFDGIGSGDLMMPRTYRIVSPRRCKDQRIFVGCDLAFMKFIIPLARSLAMSGTGAHLHLHLFDATPQAASSVVSQLDDILAGAFAVSYEQKHDGHKFFSHRRFYFAPARLMRMYQFCAFDSIPTVMLDADIMINLNLKGVFDRLLGLDAIICRMPGRIPFHTQANASIFAINPASNTAMTYLRRIAGYIHQCFEIGNVPWCLDQIAIYCTYLEMRERGGALLVGACGPKVYNGSWEDDVALWPAKCSAGHEQRTKWENASKRFQLTVEK